MLSRTTKIVSSRNHAYQSQQYVMYSAVLDYKYYLY